MEEVKELCDGVELENEDVYMATTFKDFVQLLVRKLRGEDEEDQCVINYVSAALGLALPLLLHQPWVTSSAETIAVQCTMRRQIPHLKALEGGGQATLCMQLVQSEVSHSGCESVYERDLEQFP